MHRDFQPNHFHSADAFDDRIGKLAYEYVFVGTQAAIYRLVHIAIRRCGDRGCGERLSLRRLRTTVYPRLVRYAQPMSILLDQVQLIRSRNIAGDREEL